MGTGSWTLRSKISLEAGLEMRGELERKREGEAAAAMVFGYGFREGEGEMGIGCAPAPVLFTSCLKGEAGRIAWMLACVDGIIGAAGAAVASILLAVLDSPMLSPSCTFLLPSGNTRFPVFGSLSSVLNPSSPRCRWSSVISGTCDEDPEEPSCNC